MSRTPIRTASLTRDDATSMVTLFGTVANAYRQLGIKELDITYAQFYRALDFQTITPKQKEQIEAAWKRWCFLFLREEVPASSDFTLTIENRDITPVWHPEHEEEDPEEEAPRRITAQRE